jgi:hypothetical protein
VSTLPSSDLSSLSDAEIQELFAAVVKAYATRAEDGLASPFPAGAGSPPTPTEVLVAVSDLLQAADIELFELGMWQTWGGVRPPERHP